MFQSAQKNGKLLGIAIKEELCDLNTRNIKNEFVEMTPYIKMKEGEDDKEIIESVTNVAPKEKFKAAVHNLNHNSLIAIDKYESDNETTNIVPEVKFGNHTSVFKIYKYEDSKKEIMKSLTNIEPKVKFEATSFNHQSPLKIGKCLNLIKHLKTETGENFNPSVLTIKNDHFHMKCFNDQTDLKEEILDIKEEGDCLESEREYSFSSVLSLSSITINVQKQEENFKRGFRDSNEGNEEEEDKTSIAPVTAAAFVRNNQNGIHEKSWKSGSLIFQHNKKSTKEKYVCHLCKKSFSRKKYISQHIERHTKTKYICDTCKKSFNSKRYYLEHIETHVGAKYTCETCKKSFAYKKCLPQHLSTHDLKKHICDICSKVLSTKEYLYQHKKIHRGIKYACDTCKKSFTSKKSLYRHVQKHMGIRYPCDKCSKSFTRRLLLSQHLKLHD